MNTIDKEVLAYISDEVINMRRHLHKFPEISEEEDETSTFIQRKLTKYGIPFETGYAKTGVLGIIQGKKSGGVVALRADMDGLPISEKNNIEYASVFANRMHACGHDAHTSMLLGAGYVLNKMKSKLPGTILLLFQPSEEKGPIGGAKPMMADGVFRKYKPDVIFGQHVWPDLPLGKIGVRAGEMMGNSDRFIIHVSGTGGHASMPHQSVDAIVAACKLVSTLQSIVSRNINPLESAVLTIGKIEGGYRYNTIADRVRLEGTIRTFSKDIKIHMKKKLFLLTEHVTKAIGATAKITYIDGYPATINTKKWADFIIKTAKKLFGNDSVPTIEPSLGAEDFSRFLEKYPGAFYWLGTQLDAKNDQKPLHHPQFQLNEKALPLGVQLLTKIAVDALMIIEKEKENKSEDC